MVKILLTSLWVAAILLLLVISLIKLNCLLAVASMVMLALLAMSPLGDI